MATLSECIAQPGDTTSQLHDKFILAVLGSIPEDLKYSSTDTTYQLHDKKIKALERH